MLYSFEKYKYSFKSNAILSISVNTYTKNNKIIKTNISTKKFYVGNSSKTMYLSTFFRRLYFRTMLFYINLIYSNFFRHNDNNSFYFSHFIIILNTVNHPSFYFKKFIVR